MRGVEGYNETPFSTVLLEHFVPLNQPVRPIRVLINDVLEEMDAKLLAYRRRAARAKDASSLSPRPQRDAQLEPKTETV